VTKNVAAGTLYVVSTPIGNLEDLSERAVRVLAEVDAVCCEDTRHTGQMLASKKIVARRLVSLH
jgi:16S rRNA (cytidine1402-2'-O)-methyltransferase